MDKLSQVYTESPDRVAQLNKGSSSTQKVVRSVPGQGTDWRQLIDVSSVSNISSMFSSLSFLFFSLSLPLSLSISSGENLRERERQQ